MCLKYFLKKDEEFRVSRLILAYSLRNNDLFCNRRNIDNLETTIKNKSFRHLETELAHAKKLRDLNWDFSAKYRYQKYIFRGNKCKKMRRYFTCDPNLWLCKSCHREKYLRMIDKIN